MSVEIHPRKLHGPWDGGYALDLHTYSSTFVGYDGYGHMRFDTEYSPVGKLLYQLKSQNDLTAVPLLAEAVEAFWGTTHQPPLDIIIPTPFSKVRKHQPVILVAEAISERLHIPVCSTGISKVKQTRQLKDVLEYDKRMESLKDAFSVEAAETEGKNILIFDDLYRSGATVSALTTLLKTAGKAKSVRLITLTETRSKS